MRVTADHLAANARERILDDVMRLDMAHSCNHLMAGLSARIAETE